MAVTITVSLLAGKYHATPWNHNVNEEKVEWPPSPWRVLRTLVAMGHRLQVPRKQMHKLMSQLASQLPSYQLPSYKKAHTRHWVPIVGDKGPTTSLIWDAFLATEKSAKIVITWKALDLLYDEWELLRQLCQSVSYLGRAESLAEWEAKEETLAPEEYNAFPVSAGGDIRLLAPLNCQELQGFQVAMEAIPRTGKSKAWIVPKDILEVLELRVADYHAQGWSNVPGAKWVSYEFPQETTPTTSYAPLQTVPNFALFALVAPVRPRLTDALSVGERFRQALLSRSDAHLIFSGRGQDGCKSEAQHQHAYYVPEDLNGDGKIDRVLTFAQRGFDLNAVRALQGLRKIWDNDNRDREIQVVLTALGKADYYRFDFGQDPSAGRSSLLARAKTWRSLTPVVLPRFPMYRRGKPRIDRETGLHKEGPEYQVRQMLDQLRFPSPNVVEEIEAEECGSPYPWWSFRRQRYQGEGLKGPKQGYGFRLEFSEPVSGPIALGYASHFGLGVFVPER